MKNALLSLAAATSLLLVGAGCNQNSAPAPSPFPENAPPEQREYYEADLEEPTLESALAPETAPSPTAQEPTPTPMSPQARTFPGILPAAEITNKQIHIKTAKGDIIFELFEKDAPKTVSNFVALTKDGFYNGLTFHRREEGFVIQGGDPSGNGTGGPGYKFEDEKVTRPYSRGIVAMANAGPNTNGSQFFIMLEDTPLPPNYTIFGKVLSGIEVVDKIKVGDKMTTVTIEDKK